MLVGVLIRSSAAKAAEDVRKSITTGVVFQLTDISGDSIYQVVPNEEGEMVRTFKGAIAYALKLKEILQIDGVQGYYTQMGHETLYTGLDVHPGEAIRIVRTPWRRMAQMQRGQSEEDATTLMYILMSMAFIWWTRESGIPSLLMERWVSGGTQY